MIRALIGKCMVIQVERGSLPASARTADLK